MDGMADMNAPVPPMGADPMMDDPNAIGDGMGMNNPNEDPMGGESSDEQNPMGNGDDDELMNIINNLSIEDKAAVTKYAKSMANGSDNDEETPQMDGEMPMEDKRRLRDVIDETINSIINGDTNKGVERKDKKSPRKYRHLRNNPFKSER